MRRLKWHFLGLTIKESLISLNLSTKCYVFWRFLLVKCSSKIYSVVIFLSTLNWLLNELAMSKVSLELTEKNCFETLSLFMKTVTSWIFSWTEIRMLVTQSKFENQGCWTTLWYFWFWSAFFHWSKWKKNHVISLKIWSYPRSPLAVSTDK